MRQAFQQLSLLPGRLCTRPMSSSSSVPRATIVKSPQTFLTSNTATYGLKKRKRLGRGSAGKGKTAGRGMKGFKARQSRSTPTPGFEGGQSGIIKALPKIGLQSKVYRLLFLCFHPRCTSMWNLTLTHIPWQKTRPAFSLAIAIGHTPIPLRLWETRCFETNYFERAHALRMHWKSHRRSCSPH